MYCDSLQEREYPFVFAKLKSMWRILITGSCSPFAWRGFVGGLSFFLYIVKKDSANGRLLIWRVTTAIIADNPVKGVGIREFSGEYMRHSKKNTLKKI